MILSKDTTVHLQFPQQETLALARDELFSFLERSLGIRSASEGTVQIEFSMIPDAGYSVRVEGNRLVFAGATPVEILYSVYTFAEERLGFCFFEPGRDRVVPVGRLVLEEGTVVGERTPFLKKRGLIQEFPPDWNNFRLADWMARNRLNLLLTWMKFYDLFSPEMKAYYRARGITIQSGHHNFDYFVPLKEYGQERPEYFAVIDGKRIAAEAGDTDLFLSKQLCVTQPDLRAELSRRMLDYAGAHPELNSISLIPNDGFGWCECESCAEFYDKERKGELFCVSEHVYQAQDLYQDLVGDVAGRIHRERPDLEVSFVAYVNYLNPARGFRLRENMEVQVALYWRCINHAIDDPSCPVNRRYLEALRRWDAAKEGGLVIIYEYYMGVNFYLSLPMIHHRTVFGEMRALAENGADGIMTQFHLTNWTAYGLNYWMMAKAAYGEDESAAETAFARLFDGAVPEAEALYARLRELQLSSGPCLVPVPRSLLLRTGMEPYREVVEAARRLREALPGESLVRDLEIWAEYLLRWKTVFDRYQRGEAVRGELDGFIAWAEGIGKNNVVNVARFKRYLTAWLARLETGEPWVHFNIDWEDKYVLRYDDLLNRDW